MSDHLSHLPNIAHLFRATVAILKPSYTLPPPPRLAMPPSPSTQAFATASAIIPSTTQQRRYPSDTKTTSCYRQKLRRKFVLVPDGHNIFKYFFATHDNPAAPRSHPLPSASHSDVAFQFGVVSDVQYANFPVERGVKKVMRNGVKTLVRRRRAWREAISKLAFAVQAFNKADVDFVVNLGDIIEGNGVQQTEQNEADACVVLDAFRKSKSRVYHCIGNHCRQLPMKTLQSTMKLAAPYYSFRPSHGWRGIVLNAAELSGMAAAQTDEDRDSLSRIIREEKRGVHHFHGAIGQAQLDWFAQQLDEAKAAQEYVIVFSHYPLADEAARSSHVLANTKAVRSIIERPGSPVVLCLAGHDHMGGRLLEPGNHTRGPITYVTMPAILEAPRGSNAYAFVTAYTDGSVNIAGIGTVPSTTIRARRVHSTS